MSESNFDPTMNDDGLTADRRPDSAEADRQGVDGQESDLEPQAQAATDSDADRDTGVGEGS